MTDRERLSQLEEVVAEMLGKQDMLAEDMASLNVKMASLNSEIAHLKAKITRLESKTDKHTQMLAELQHDIRDGQAELRSGIDSILTLLKK